jgi:F-type H+-transporting ATPase subunit alpha
LDDVEIEKVKDFEKGLLEFVEEKYKDVLDKISEEKDISDEKKLKKIVEEFKEKFVG